MKTKIFLSSILVCLFVFQLSYASAACRIMPLGDSITWGVGYEEVGDDAYRFGYRHYLWQDLVGAGHTVDFVGSLRSGYSVSGFDANHEGRGGETAAYVATYVYQWLVNNPPDLVLLHIGTNDLNSGFDVETSVENVENVLNNIDVYESTYNREVAVILAQIINRQEHDSLTSAFNTALRSLAETRQTAGDRLVLVDMENALLYPDDMYDLLHPNGSGYSKMADVWLGGLQSFLPCGSPTHSIWNPDSPLGTTRTGNSSPTVLGVKFRSDVDGYITGIRFYKGSLNTGTHTGSLWTANGINLGSVTYTDETASGWQQADFATPIPVTANTTYIASYYAPNGSYTISRPYFTSAGIDNPPLHALQSGVDGLNGVYCTSSASCFPSASYLDSNYWVDVVFENNLGPVAPLITSTPVTSAVVGQVYTYDVNATGSPTPTYALTAYPSGMTINSTTGLIEWTPQSAGPFGVTVEAINDGGSDTQSFTIEVTEPAASYSIWNPDSPLGTTRTGNSSPTVLGVKFRSDVDGYITGIRFYKGSLNTGTHTGSLWTANGINLGSVTYTDETASGWQQADFATPIPVTANTTYIASYYAPNGSYTISRPYFTSAGIDNPPLHALQSGVDGLNGVYCTSSASCFPSASYLDSNYWVDVVFENNLGPVAPLITSTPVTSAVVGQVYTYDVNATGSPTPTYALTAYPSGMTINSTTGLIEWTPQSAGPFGVTVEAINDGGSDTQSFTIEVTEPAASYSIWNPDSPLGTTRTGNSSPTVLGVKFRSDVDGYITGIRFYKGSLNTGTHTGSLWTANGINLGSVTYTDETASGWQQADFATPIPVTANTTYIASYYAPNGSYTISRPYFTSAGIDNPPLHALQSGVDGLNGVYCTSSASCFPTASYLDSNYWVDVVFRQN